MNNKKILIVIGTRPNFIKVTQFKRIVQQYPNLQLDIIHTGQHFDDKMSNIFFEQFGLTPDYFMNIKPSSPTNQMAEIMIKLEDHIIQHKPDLVMVVGDVNSTAAAAMAANKCQVKVCHLESGLRSFDRAMPEEINRLVADSISDIFFVTEQSGLDNLKSECKPQQEIHFVGNTMIDTMVAFEDRIESCEILEDFNINYDEFVLMTIHRPQNVDGIENLRKLCTLITEITKNYKVVFPIHPRTKNSLIKFDLNKILEKNENLILPGPLGYFEFQKLIKHCKFVLTDSGGIQEETTFRLKPCLTLRPNTERPSTCKIGTNTLIDFELDKIFQLIESIEKGTYKKGVIPKFWDGKSTERIVAILDKLF